MGTRGGGARQWWLLGAALLSVSGWVSLAAPEDCSCSPIRPGANGDKRCIQYYIDLPAGCRPTTLSLVDTTSAAVVWDRTIWSEADFLSLSEEAQERQLGNDPIIGIESNRIYTYEGPNGTLITIARREGDPNKWLLELCSFCHAIPTVQVGVACPGERSVRKVEVGLTFDERDQYVVKGLMLVNGRELTRANYNSFFQDCSVPYCYADERATHDSLKGNGWISIMMPPDPKCKLDLDAFREELCEALAAAGCRCDISYLDTRDGSLRGYIRTNRCTPQVAACVERVLKRYTDCKQITWIGRQIVIRPRPKPRAKTGVSVGAAAVALDLRVAKSFLLATLEEVPLPLEGLGDAIAGLPPLAPVPLFGGVLSIPVPLGSMGLAASFLTDGMLRGAGLWPAGGLELGPQLAADFHLLAYRFSLHWELAVDLWLLAAGFGMGFDLVGGRFHPQLASPDPEIQALLPGFCPDAFGWLTAGPSVRAFCELGPPFLRLTLAGWWLLPLYQAPGEAGLLVAPPGGSLTFSLRF